MSNALAKKEEARLPAQAMETAGEEILKTDVVIPMLLLQQGLSDYVLNNQAKMGDMVRSTNAEKLGDDKTPLEFIPITIKNLWVISELVGKKFQFRKIIPRRSVVAPADVADEANRQDPDRQDENLPWEFTHMGTQWKRTKLLNVYALLPKDIEAFQAEIEKAKDTGEMPDLDKTLMPIVIPFRSTSFPAGKTVVTHFTKARSMAHIGAKAHGFALKLSCYSDKNDQGTFYVYEVGGTRKATKAEMVEAEKWAGILRNQEVRVHSGVGDSDGETASSKF